MTSHAALTPTPVRPAPARRPGLLRLVALAAVAAVVAAGCAYGGTPVSAGALRAGDVTVSVAELTDDIDYLAAHPAVASSLIGSDVSAAASGGPGAAEARMQAAVGLLNLYTFTALLGQAATDTGVSPDGADRSTAVQTVDRLTAQAPGMPAGLNDTLVRLVELQTVLGRDLAADVSAPTPDEVRAAYEATVGDGSEFADYRCASHILVAFTDSPAAGVEPTADEEAAALAGAEQVAERLAAGESFADVASEVSDDPGSAARGGDLGCNFPGTYVAEFEAALAALDVDGVSAPVRTQFGYHVIRLDAVGPPALDDVAADIEAQLASERTDPQALLLDLLEQSADGFDVEVNPRFGSWDAAQLAVVPPAGPGAAAVLSPPMPVGLEDLLGGATPSPAP